MTKSRAVRGGSYHWRVYGIGDLLPSADESRDVLLLGCGDGGELPLLRERGFRGVGLDIRPSDRTDVLGDAHALPFADSSFDVVLSMQVLEHLHSPWTAVDEVARILRPGGWFLGSVAFLKPYHGSYFHMTHEGVRSLLGRAGFEVDRLAGAQSLAYTFAGGAVPLMPLRVRRMILNAVDRVVLGARSMAWALLRRTSAHRPTQRFDDTLRLSFSEFDKLRYAPAVVFRGRKEG